jgi:hypothetical protein
MSLIDKIRYGNPSLEYKETYFKRDKLTEALIELGLYEQLFKMPPPSNSSEKTVKELKSCVKLINEASDMLISFCKEAEDDYCQLFIDYLNRHGVYDITKEDLNNIIYQLDPLTFRLKYHYNRPRPYQLAYYYDLDLYVPIMTERIDHPSYPSGHALEGFVISELLAQKYPEHKNHLLKLGKNIGLSRMIIGVHYKSDYDFGRLLGKIIIENQLIDSL